MSHSANCIFCKIIKGEISSAKIYEDDYTYAFLDIGPVNKGHALVIPKEHVEKFTELSDEQAKQVIAAVKKVARAVQKGVKADALTITLSNGEAAGQVVPHAHFHIIPRFKGDGLKLWPQGKYEEGEMQNVAENIIKNM